jgi:hypothetical protein
MTEPRVAPHGSWNSPITSDLIVAGSVRLGRVTLDGTDVYWLEGRPTERGRSVLVRQRADGTRTDVTPAPFNVRTRVHEYGGGEYLVDGGDVFFVNFADQRVYVVRDDQEPQPITPELPLRYADFVLDCTRDHLVCVREDHIDAGHEAVNTIVSLNSGGDAAGGDAAGGRVLVAGNDFYATPRLSPDGARLAWLTWRHPNMPWDGCELWVGELDAAGEVRDAQLVAGSVTESIFQPTWSPDGVLYFVSDRTGWWNLYRWRDGQVEPLAPLEAEFGQPQWAFGMSTYAFESADRIICTYTQAGVDHLAALDTRTKQLTPIETEYTEINLPTAAPGSSSRPKTA